MMEQIREWVERINNATTSEEIEQLRTEGEKQYGEFNMEKYPPLNFIITKDELLSIDDKWEIDDETDPRIKLLYACIWKQGDLLKLRSIKSGIMGEINNKKTGAVFHQFGKHLANPQGEPIIDQNVLRAFAQIYYFNEPAKAKSWLTKATLTKTDSILINAYRNWVGEKKLDTQGMYQLDKLMFCFGAGIKEKRKTIESD